MAFKFFVLTSLFRQGLGLRDARIRGGSLGLQFCGGRMLDSETLGCSQFQLCDNSVQRLSLVSLLLKLLKLLVFLLLRLPVLLLCKPWYTDRTRAEVQLMMCSMFAPSQGGNSNRKSRCSTRGTLGKLCPHGEELRFGVYYYVE